jgi:hypothetical protein
MGGVDVMDKLLASYRPSIQSKKWYFPFLTHFLNVCVTNAWILHRKAVEHPMTHLQFRRDVANALMNANTDNFYVRRENPGHQPVVVPVRRFEGWNHFPASIDRQLRCAECHQKAKFKCIQCSVTLHPLCFHAYHTRPQ